MTPHEVGEISELPSLYWKPHDESHIDVRQSHLESVLEKEAISNCHSYVAGHVESLSLGSDSSRLMGYAIEGTCKLSFWRSLANNFFSSLPFAKLCHQIMKSCTSCFIRATTGHYCQRVCIGNQWTSSQLVDVRQPLDSTMIPRWTSSSICRIAWINYSWRSQWTAQPNTSCKSLHSSASSLFSPAQKVSMNPQSRRDMRDNCHPNSE